MTLKRITKRDIVDTDSIALIEVIPERDWDGEYLKDREFVTIYFKNSENKTRISNLGPVEVDELLAKLDVV